MRRLLGIGASGGIIPCPTALAVVLALGLAMTVRALRPVA
jgi:ABC-type nickel/cobalt efflux system permease component RcnA